MVDESVLRSVRKYLETLTREGLAVSFGVLFGSHATGSAGQWSDIDLLVVSPLFDNMRDRKLVDRLWHAAARVDSRIEPVPCGERQWREDDSNTILEWARREGIQIKAS